MNYRNKPYPVNTDALIDSCKSIAVEFDSMLDINSPQKFYLKDFYKQKDGNNKADRNALRELFHCNSVNPKYSQKEIKGIYVFAAETKTKVKPYYVGISQTIIRRLRQHVFGTAHNQATLAYLMARAKYTQLEKKPYSGLRSDLPYFLTHRRTFQDDILQARFAIKEIDDDYLLYMAEVFIACHYQTVWNSFETH